MDKIKKSHHWEEAVSSKCPYCGNHNLHVKPAEKGIQVKCNDIVPCGKTYELGRRRTAGQVKQ